MVFKVLGIIFVFLTLVDNTFSQRKTVSGNEFSSVISKAEEKSRIFPRRHRVVEETFVKGKLVKTNSLVWEAVSYEENRSVEIEKTDGRTTKIEKIRIGLDVYQRKDEGNWTKEEWSFEHGLTRQITEILGCVEFSVEKETFEKQDAQVFESFSITKEQDKLGYEQERYWISDSGILIRIETIAGLLNPRDIAWHKTLDFQYDPSIKIEAPIK